MGRRSAGGQARARRGEAPWADFTGAAEARRRACLRQRGLVDEPVDLVANDFRGEERAFVEVAAKEKRDLRACARGAAGEAVGEAVGASVSSGLGSSRIPQSEQSVPRSQELYSAPAPPSSQSSSAE